MKTIEKEAFEKNYFDEMYDGEYDKRNPDYKFVSYVNEIKPFLPKNADTLDIGCAYGAFLKQAKKYYNIHGTDISEHAISVAKSRLGDIKIFQSDVLNIPTDKQFDAITCFDVLEHVPEIDQALQHIKKLLKPGGVLIITVPVYDTIVGSLVGKLDKDPTHVHKNSRYWWKDLLKRNSFEVLKWKGIWRYYFKNMFYLHYCSSITKTFTPAIMIISKNV